jgi:branched-chain amino acid transport system substrate-binding protein
MRKRETMRLKHHVAVAGAIVSSISIFGLSTASASSASSASLPSTITIGVNFPLTGPFAAPAGIPELDGLKLALQDINRSHLLGKTKLKIDVIDSQSSTPQAVVVTSELINNPAIVAMIGPLASVDAVATVPLAARANMPDVLIQSSAAGLLNQSKYIFRVTPPQDTLSTQSLTAKYLKSHGAKSVDMLVETSTADINTMGTKIFPQLFKSSGITVKHVLAITATQADFTAQVEQVVADNPSAVGVMDTAAPNATIISELRAHGYNGKLFATQSIGGPTVLGGVSQQAQGLVFAEPIDLTAKNSKNVTFDREFKAAYPSITISTDAIDGYNAMYLLAKALTLTKSISRPAIQAAIQKAMKTPLNAAGGTIRFTNRDAVGTSSLLQWNNGALAPITP